MKEKIKKLAVSAAMMIGGGAIGIFIASFIYSMDEDISNGEFFLWVALYIVLVYAAYFVHIIVHESGHLVFGLVSGYEFSSFRIGSIIITKEEGKLRLSRFSLAGTAGQCLLSPPEGKEGDMPYKLYNLGGVIFNVILMVLSLALYFAFPRVHVLSVFLVELFAVGLLVAAANGIPVRGLVNNDGANVLELGRDAHARRSLSVQLRINGMLAKGKRLRDMPAELFELDAEADENNRINSTITVFRCNRLMDEHRFAEARELCEKLIASEGVMPVYKNLLTCDLACCEMLAGEAQRAASRFTKEQKKFMAAMASNPSILRTQYACALICEKDSAKAEKHLAAFEKMAKAYPYKSDIESERELIEELKRAVMA